MKALVVEQPYAQAMTWGDKKMLCLPHSTEYKGELLICSPHRFTGQDKLFLYTTMRKLRPGVDISDLDFGSALMVFELLGCFKVPRGFHKTVKDPERSLTKFCPGWFCWVLDDPRIIEPFALMEYEEGKLFEVNYEYRYE
jgi:hypothetical protein